MQCFYCWSHTEAITTGKLIYQLVKGTRFGPTSAPKNHEAEYARDISVYTVQSYKNKYWKHIFFQESQKSTAVTA
jgi:hypothetical protein